METKNLSFLSKFIGSCFYIGYSPIAPGTVASIAAAISLFFLPKLSIITYFLTLNILFFVGAVVAEKVAIITKQKDNQIIVIDEWFGMCLALFLAPKNIFVYLIALVVFRIFDIIKPMPILYIENNVPGGLGVMLDDACAGFFTFLIIQIVTLFF